MIATGGTTGSLDGHYLHHGEADRSGQYVEKSERVKFSSARHLAGDPENRHHMTKQLRAQAKKNGRAEKPFFHAKLSLDTGERTGQDAERLSLSEWEQVMGDYAEKMDLSGRQCWMVVHKDTAHEHAHLYFGRVDADGELWNDSQSWPRSQDAVREIEQARGLRRVQGTLGKYTGENLGRSDVGQRTPPERGQQIPGAAVAEYKRTGEVPFAMQAKEAKKDLREAGSWRELEGRLAVRGMELEERGGGAVLRKIGGAEKHRTPLHKVDRQSTFPKLENKLGPYHERDRGHDERPRAREQSGLGRDSERGARGAKREVGAGRETASEAGGARRGAAGTRGEAAAPGDRAATGRDRDRSGKANERDHAGSERPVAGAPERDVGRAGPGGERGREDEQRTREAEPPGEKAREGADLSGDAGGRGADGLGASAGGRNSELVDGPDRDRTDEGRAGGAGAERGRGGRSESNRERIRDAGGGREKSLSGDAQRGRTADREEDRAELPDPDHFRPEGKQFESDQLRQVARDLRALRRTDELDEKAERLEKEKQAAERQKERHGPGSGSGWLDRRADAKTEAEEIGAELRATQKRREEGAEWTRERFPTARNPREALRRDAGERLHEMGEQERERLPEDLQGRADALASAHAERLQREMKKAIEKDAQSLGRDRGRDRGMGMGM